jgi:HAD superfamily hydrolase (TIGR01509 family)
MAHPPRPDARSPHSAALRGTLVRGRGEAAGFTQLDWVRRQLLGHFGIDPHPGTLNLRIAESIDRSLWESLRRSPGATIDPPDASSCQARGYAMRLDGLPVAAVVPDVPGYPDDTVELVASVAVREHFGIDDGHTLSVEPWAPLQVRAVLFDVDGTLVDSLDAYFEIARLACTAHGYAVTMAQVLHSLATGQSFWRSVVPDDAPDREGTLKAMSAHARREWPRVLREHCRVHAAVGATLDALKARGFELGIVTAGDGAVVELLREAGLGKHFSAVVTGKDVARRKPDPEGLALCLERMGVAASEAAYVGDTPLDIDASHAAGAYVLGVLSGAADSAMLTRHAPHRLMPTLAPLPDMLERI